MKNSILFLALTSMVTIVPGCDQQDDDSSHSSQKGTALEKVAPEDRYIAAEEVTGYLAGEQCSFAREDKKGEITITPGHWGSWATCWHYCPDGSYAYGVEVRSEAQQGSGDDTAANAISFACHNKSNGNYHGEIINHAGYWGEWGSNPSSNSFTNPIIGGKIRIEAPQGGGDDTSANAFIAKLVSGSLSPSSQAPWGAWTSYTTCPAGQAVCGVKVRMETPQGGGVDDTALNGVKLACCTF